MNEPYEMERRPLCVVCYFADPRPVVYPAIATINGHSVCRSHVRDAARDNDFMRMMELRAKALGLSYDQIKLNIQFQPRADVPEVHWHEDRKPKERYWHE